MRCWSGKKEWLIFMITIWVPKRLVEIDLYNVAAQNPAALAQMSEQSYRQRVEYAARKIRDSRAKIVMLTGPSASGKTTSAHKVAEALEASGTPAHVISLDNFFKGAQYYPRLPDGTLDYENPDTLDMPLIRQCRSPAKTLAMWDRVLDGETRYIKGFKTTADFLLDTSFTYELGLIAKLLRKVCQRFTLEGHNAELWDETARRFEHVAPVELDLLPADSMLREFYAGEL